MSFGWTDEDLDDCYKGNPPSTTFNPKHSASYYIVIIELLKENDETAATPPITNFVIRIIANIRNKF